MGRESKICDFESVQESFLNGSIDSILFISDNWEDEIKVE